ncbi:tripartite tricarboxylate transporter TctB family protein [Ornithinimicrobium cavernae]|uniref:tripartite tricarboxylate transporter TctB family protein n=1 Tax=Ornithinimicrobium cavernae TaxID=2666047 RepID=UPI000D69220C|nr:tripartite tricarboxylate transporter TctB family protein [Ornithinimicrobium cavernae]
MAEQDVEAHPEVPTSRAPGYVIGAIFLVAGLVLAVGSLGFPDAVGRSDPGPGFMPRVVGIGLILCAVPHLLRVPAPAAADEKYPERSALARISLVFVAMVAYAYLLRELGFILTTAVFMVATLWLAHVRKPVFLAVITLITALGVHGVFAELLNVPLPRGLVEGWLP